MADLARIMNAAEALRRAFRPVRDVADKAGEVSVIAEVRLRDELDKLELAKGTRGQFRGKVPGSSMGRGYGKGSSGGSRGEPPEEVTLRELGISKKRAARALRLASGAASGDWNGTI
jgi:hypothetical protein